MPAEISSSPADGTVSLPRRRPETSKRDYGRVAIVGGSAGMAGAPALAAMAALRSGAGLVELLVPDAVVAIAASFDPCVMTHGFPCLDDGTFSAAASGPIDRRLTAADAVAVGPGLGRSPAARDLAVCLWHDLRCPAVFDADALWAVATLDAADRRSHAGPRVVTPHAGELLRLIGREPGSAAAEDRSFLEREATALAAATDAVVVLKGHRSLIVGPHEHAHNATGNPGMATAGTGDVLTGVTAALLAQGLAPFAAARLAAWIHGRAGDAAAAELGEISMTARDLLDRLHVAFRAAGHP
jgi:ADP-dependent NAD(P)H-hydrate dehydratase